MEKLLIRHARLLDPSQELDAVGDLLLEHGKIVQLGGEISAPDAKVLEANGLIAAPGLVDMHVHLRDPGQTHKEDIITGCKAAAVGGVTSVLAMPNTIPAADNVETIRYVLDKAQYADARVYVAAAITHDLRGEVMDDLQALRDAGAIALSDDGRPVENTRFMAQAMLQAPKLGMRVVSHCEDLFLAHGGLMNEGEVSKQLGIPGIPAAAEDCGTARDIALAAAYQVPIHICHVSTRTSLELIRDAKRRGVAVTAETAPHYFSLTDQELLKQDADYRMNPPLRTEADRLAVVQALQDGTLDAIATDHAPHTPKEKSDFRTAPNGAIGMETSLAAGITFLVEPGLLTLSKLIRLMSLNPAKLLGLDAGTLRVGAPADVVVFDDKQEWTVNPEALHGKSHNAVLKGRTLRGKVKATVCRGKLVFQDGI